MEFFNKISEKASTAYKVTAAKTGKLAKEAKLKLKMSNLKSQINDIYLDIGAKIYEKHLFGHLRLFVPGSYISCNTDFYRTWMCSKM